MPNKNKSNDTLRRLLFIVTRIPSKARPLNAADLHKKVLEAGYPCTLRTTQRDLKMLSEHFQIDINEDGKELFYSWNESAKGLTIPALTPHDSLLLTLAQKHLEDLLPARVMNSMKSFFLAAEQNLDATQAERDKGWLSKVRVVSATQPLLPPKIKREVLEAIGSALYSDNYLNVRYDNRRGDRKEASIKPLGLVQQGVRLYLVAQFETYDNYRILAINRIISAELSALAFKRPDDFDLQAYDDEGKFGMGDGKRIRLSFSVNKLEGVLMLESPLSKDQIFTERDDSYRITATVIQTKVLDRWLRGYGEDIWDIETTPLQS